MATETPHSNITVVRNAILEFLEDMEKSKRIVEQEIRDATDNVLTKFLNQGLVQITLSDVQKLSRSYRDAFLDYYKNIIFLRIISNASHKIKIAIEEGFDNPEIIQNEWLEGIDEIKAQLAHMNELAETVKSYKDKIDEQAAIITELSSSSSMSSSDLELYQNALEERDNLIRERDQIITEKDEEILNLSQGLAHMEGQSNNLGSQLLQYNMQIEELQEAVNERDELIEALQNQLKNKGASDEEVGKMRAQLAEAENTIRKLEKKVSGASSDLMDELQDTLEKTRTQVLELRREIVQKNEKLHNSEMEKEELIIQTKNAREKLENTEKELNEANKKLQAFQGKVSISAEEQEKISSKVSTLKEQMSENTGSLEYLSKLVGSDVKFRTLFFIQSLGTEVRIDNLAQGVGIPQSIAHKILIELSKDNLVETRKDGRFLYATSVEKEVPFTLTG